MDAHRRPYSGDSLVRILGVLWDCFRHRRRWEQFRVSPHLPYPYLCCSSIYCLALGIGGQYYHDSLWFAVRYCLSVLGERASFSRIDYPHGIGYGSTSIDFRDPSNPLPRKIKSLTGKANRRLKM
jgi:hypothetical protein